MPNNSFGNRFRNTVIGLVLFALGIALSLYISGIVFSIILDIQYQGNSGVLENPLVFKIIYGIEYS